MRPEVVLKPWGRELIICNTPLYCGKILEVYYGLNLSLHKHLIKTEHLHLEIGKVEILYGEQDNLSSLILEEGETFFVPTGLLHQIYAIEGSRIIEFSTQHFDSDSHRVTREYVGKLKG